MDAVKLQKNGRALGKVCLRLSFLGNRYNLYTITYFKICEQKRGVFLLLQDSSQIKTCIFFFHYLISLRFSFKRDTKMQWAFNDRQKRRPDWISDQIYYLKKEIEKKKPLKNVKNVKKK